MPVVGEGLLDADVADGADGPVVRLAGEVDVANVSELDDALRNAEQRMPAHGLMAVDLKGLSFIDSAGLGALVRLHNRLEDSSCHLVLRNPPAHIRRVLDIGGLSAVITVD
jgi:anti-sigma B factor antagonist